MGKVICKKCGSSDNVVEVFKPDTKMGFWVCQACEHVIGRRCEVFSRIVGYLRPVSQWNVGKKEEFKHRKTFNVVIENERKDGVEVGGRQAHDNHTRA